MNIKPVDEDEKSWGILCDQIVRGNVIPVIGPELVHIGNKSSVKFLIDAISDECGIKEGTVNTFSQLAYNEGYQNKKLGEIHDLLTQTINSPENAEYFDNMEDNELLLRFLRIKYFPFVISTLFDPIVENMMRHVHREKLRVLCFRNNPGLNDDIMNAEETKLPTLYYMFGKADGKAGSFVVTAEDLLNFSKSWMQPNDSNNKVKPSKLSDEICQKYLLVLGYDYQDWLFRLFWFAMKSDSFGTGTKHTEQSGMLAHIRQDGELVSFLTNQAKAFCQLEPDMNKLVDRICKGVKEAEKRLDSQRDNCMSVPEGGTDVFISYSRGDSILVEEIYQILISKGLNVWFDRQNMHKGQNFMRQIENAIKNSTFFVPVFTNTIIQQAGKEHPYRDEWKFAEKHIRRIGGVSYCFPFFEENFNMDDILADIPDELKRNDAFSFNSINYKEKAEKLAEYLFIEKEKINKHG